MDIGGPQGGVFDMDMRKIVSTAMLQADRLIYVDIYWMVVQKPQNTPHLPSLAHCLKFVLFNHLGSDVTTW